ncbi:uncharacterized protein LOC132644210 [Lycium barbarum]|uniref:uncharacterized protein LOC132644210 n=1 Tax=Lycium barbarum TaxID=112863 RepID=UPI00293F0941|nr:uncharacterized protein LOC132644210 [Lycium barbarum]
MLVSDYFSKLSDFWNEFDAIIPCPGCPCPESKKFIKHFEYQRLLQFLMELNKSYSQARGQILIMSSTPNLNKENSLIVDQESQRNLASAAHVSLGSGTIEGTTLFSHKGSGIGGGDVGGIGPSVGGVATGNGHYGNHFHKPQKQFTICEMCGYKGHTKEKCFKIVVYPPGWKTRRKNGPHANQVALKQPIAHMAANPDLYTEQVKGIGKEECGVYILREGGSHQTQVQVQPIREVVNTASSAESSFLWHKRLGHASVDIIKRVPTYNNKRYFVTIVDDFSRYTWVFFITSKSNTIVVLRQFLTQVRNVFSTTVKTLRTDNRGEFFSSECQTMLNEYGIIHQSSCVYTPQQNDIAERKHKTILDMARALRFQDSVPLRFWAYIEPCSFKEASADPKWVQAKQLEIAALEDNKTWSLVDLAPGKKPVGCRWIYKAKSKSTGEIERFKSRLVAKGYSQKEGLDYGETFSPIAKMVTIRSVVAIAAAKH